MSRTNTRTAKKRTQPVPHGVPAKRAPARGAKANRKAASSTHRNRSAVSSGARPAIRSNSKLARLVALLRRPGGASLDSLMAETGWQAHSVRGAIAGAVKKKLGLRVDSDRVEGARVYRIVNAG